MNEMNSPTRDELIAALQDMISQMEDDDLESFCSIGSAFFFSGQTHALVSGFSFGMDIIMADECIKSLRQQDFSDN